MNSAKEDTKILVNEENIGYNFNSNSLESLINKLSEININEIDIMKRKSYNIYKKKLSGESYYSDMDNVLQTINKSIN